MTHNFRQRALSPFAAIAAVVLALIAGVAAAAPPAHCTRIVLTGQANAGSEWRQPFGQGWVFRLVPVAPGKAAYSGWDLVVDRDPPAGFPDALLLATPPYDSISEREFATTFGLRAQDALGWNPRSFHFLTDPKALLEARKQFQILGGTTMETPVLSAEKGTAAQRLLAINQRASAGQFRILNARIVPGAADPAPFAQAWALRASGTPHTIDPAAPTTPRGTIQSVSFSITLWLPADWSPPQDLHPIHAPCAQ